MNVTSLKQIWKYTNTFVVSVEILSRICENSQNSLNQPMNLLHSTSTLSIQAQFSVKIKIPPRGVLRIFRFQKERAPWKKKIEFLDFYSGSVVLVIPKARNPWKHGRARSTRCPLHPMYLFLFALFLFACVFFGKERGNPRPRRKGPAAGAAELARTPSLRRAPL